MSSNGKTGKSNPVGNRPSPYSLHLLENQSLGQKHSRNCWVPKILEKECYFTKLYLTLNYYILSLLILSYTKLLYLTIPNSNFFQRTITLPYTKSLFLTSFQPANGSLTKVTCCLVSFFFIPPDCFVYNRGWYTFQKVKVDPIIEQIPMDGYIISNFA